MSVRNTTAGYTERRLISIGSYTPCRNGCNAGEKGGSACIRCKGYGVEPGSWVPPVYEDQTDE